MPKARGLVGASYPLITHMALNEFTDDANNRKTQSAQPIKVHRDETPPKIDTKPVYPIESGLIPHYTGHVPGKYQNKCTYPIKNCITKKHPIKSFVTISGSVII